MRFVGLLRIKNESRWIQEVLIAARTLCDHVYIIDDHSTDNTVELCQLVPGVTVFPSPFDTMDEARDKTWLMQQIRLIDKPDWVLMIDGDEVLEPAGAEKIRELVQDEYKDVYAFQVLYYWNDVNTIRMDGIYGRFFRPSLFRFRDDCLEFLNLGKSGNLHCSNVPRMYLTHRRHNVDVKLLHYGYIDEELRRRKYEFYNRVDPNNQDEDQYRHVVQGDPVGPAANMRLKHAGPLQLVKRSELLG